MIEKLFSFDGRISRATMWVYYLISSAAAPVVLLLGPWNDMGKGTVFVPWPTTTPAVAFRVLQFAWVLAVFWVMLAAVVKRLHDRGRGAVWLLLFYGVPLFFFGVIYCVVVRAQILSPLAWIFAGAAFLITFANNLWYLAELFVLPGTLGTNEFGPDPRERTLSSPAERPG